MKQHSIMLNETPNQKILRRLGLHSLSFNGTRQTERHTGYNRLMYWGVNGRRIVLFDLDNNNPKLSRGNFSRQEMLRNIQLVVDNGAFVKRFGKCHILPTEDNRETYLRLLIGNPPSTPTPPYRKDVKEKILREDGCWDLIEQTVTSQHWSQSADRTQANTPDKITVMDIFQAYIEANTSTEHIKLHDELYFFSLVIPGTPGYCIDYTPTGGIRKLYIHHNGSKEPTIQEVLQMSHRVNIELAPLVTKAKTCFRIEETYEPDDDPETETVEVCST